jgi:hypothetical protein
MPAIGTEKFARSFVTTDRAASDGNPGLIQDLKVIVRILRTGAEIKPAALYVRVKQSLEGIAWLMGSPTPSTFKVQQQTIVTQNI